MPKTLLEMLKEEAPWARATPIVVSCFYCEMTMWSTSANCLVDERGKITCPQCAGAEDRPE